MKSKRYNLFVENGEEYRPYKMDGTHLELPAGAYSPYWDHGRDQVVFNKLKLNCDNIIDLPSKEYDYVISQMRHFLSPETKQKYQDNGFLYKRSAMLHGKPGTGKTVIVNRVTQEALAKGAVVLFNPDPAYMVEFFEALEATAPDKLTLVIFEEFEDLVQKHENDLLSLLDGEVQKNNIIYLATTNYIDQIPIRMQRPGRFSSIIEVGLPTAEARSVYLKVKKIKPDLIPGWVELTEGFSVDELKETVLAVNCLDEKLPDVVTRLRDLKAKGLEAEVKKAEAPGPAEILESIFGGVAPRLSKSSRPRR